MPGETADTGTPPDSFRLYAGYVGWTAKQLEDEVARGLWKVTRPKAESIFDREY